MEKNIANLYTKEYLSKFKQAISSMTTSSITPNIIPGSNNSRVDMSIETISNISPSDKKSWRKYSRAFYNTSMYRRLLKYLATLSYNHYMVTPLLEADKKINNKKLIRDYNAVLRTLDEDFNIESFTSNVLLNLLIEGEVFYYLSEYNKRSESYFKPLRLPADYCKIIGTAGNPAINVFALDVSFIDDLTKGYGTGSTIKKEDILKQYPKDISNAYNKYKNNKGSKWFVVPVSNGMAFSTEDGRPPFSFLLKTLSRIDKFEDLRDDYIATNLTKLLVQLIDIDKEGNPEVDLEIAAEFHKNLREIASKKNNVDALTTLAKDVRVLSLGETGDAAKNYDVLETYYDQYYEDSGVPKEMFNSTTAGTMAFSEIKDEAFIDDLRKPIEIWFNFFLKNICKKRVSKNTIFVFSYLQTSYKNREKMIDGYLKGAQYGFSKLAPQIAMGVKQRYIESLVRFENDVLDLDAKLVPLQSSHTLSKNGNAEQGETKPTQNDSDVEAKTNGRPVKEQDEKQDSTIAKDASK